MNLSPEITDRFIGKTVTHRFGNRNLSFGLSPSLFSGFKIDDGTRLLLKTLKDPPPSAPPLSVLDLGCGTGVIGICLAAAYPQARVVCQDRDALASAVTRSNAKNNGLALETGEGLGFSGLQNDRFDLIVSNIPAKASEPVFRDWVKRAAFHLTEKGFFAAVVVEPLRRLWTEILEEYHAEILRGESGPGHHVFHFRPAVAGEPAPDLLTPSLRTRFTYESPSASFTLRTVYGLPEFDTLGRHSELLLESLSGNGHSGRVLIWNPGQGHTAVFLSTQPSAGMDEILLAGRDALSLAITRLNLEENGFAKAKIRTLHSPSFLGTEGSYDLILIHPDDDPGAPEKDLFLPHAASLLGGKGKILLAGPTTEIQRLLKASPLRAVREKKKKGFLCTLLSLP